MPLCYLREQKVVLWLRVYSLPFKSPARNNHDSKRIRDNPLLVSCTISLQWVMDSPDGQILMVGKVEMLVALTVQTSRENSNVTTVYNRLRVSLHYITAMGYGLPRWPNIQDGKGRNVCNLHGTNFA